jgi:nucleotide-binding universal stress UspA family protein
MAYATLMVHLDLEHSNDSRLQITADLAQRFEANVMGVAASERSAPLYFAEGAYAQELADREQADIRNRLRAAEELFTTKFKRHPKSVEWRGAIAVPGPYVATQARAADLIITGSRRDVLYDLRRQLDPNELVLQAGRPVFLTPPEAEWFKFGSALIAWKDTREARRAVLGALPLLRQIKDVTVTEISEGGARADDAQAHVKDVVAWLGRHGVTASGFVPATTDEAARQIERIAADVGADCIVAGAYGRSRANEWIFGGVSRNLLMKSRRCCLVAH